MKQYHFAVYVEMDEHGDPGLVIVDDSMTNFGVGSDYVVFDDETDEWEMSDEDWDTRALAKLLRVIHQSQQAGASEGDRTPGTDASHPSP
jgi:hypothetical protein